jgi:hypothetical protein
MHDILYPEDNSNMYWKLTETHLQNDNGKIH